MGTSGVAHIHEGPFDSPSICHVYKQSDGYPDDFGDQIKEVLGRANLVNGIRFDLENQINGMGCAAATLVAAVKCRAGGIYMLREAPKWSDYDYHLYHTDKMPEPGETPARMRMMVMAGSKILWDGNLADFVGKELYEDEE